MKKYLSVILIIQNIASGQSIVQHVEPLNWWVGMKNPTL